MLGRGEGGRAFRLEERDGVFGGISRAEQREIDGAVDRYCDRAKRR
jgi:hypothetical protein